MDDPAVAKGGAFRAIDHGEYPQEEASKRAHRTKLKKVCRRAGIKPAAATLHALRHSFGAHLRMAGVPLANIADLMGHADLATTQIYAKVQIEHLREAVGQLGPLVPERMSLENVTPGGGEEPTGGKSLEQKDLEVGISGWLGRRDSNPDSAVQSRMSCH